MNIEPSRQEKGITQNQGICIAIDQSKLREKEIKKLHRYWGHCNTDKLNILIKNAGKLTEEVNALLEFVKRNCESCNVI